MRFVLGVEKSLRFNSVFCGETGLLSCLVVVDVKNFSPSEHPVFLFHAHNAFVTSLRKTVLRALECFGSALRVL